MSLPDPVALGTSRRMAATLGRDNQVELRIRSLLHRKGIRFRIHRSLIPGSRRTADIVLPAARVAIFVDGCFWHGCPVHGTWPKNNAAWWREKIEKNRQRDRDTDARLWALGWRVIRVWEHERPDVAVEEICRLIAPPAREEERVLPGDTSGIS